MKSKRQRIIQHLLLLLALPIPHMASANDPYQPYSIESPPQPVTGLDGEWITEIPFTPPDEWGWGFRISGDIGILTMSYSPNTTKTKVGDVKLRISTKTSTAFRGYLICADGNPYPVNGELLQDGRLGMQVSGACHPTNWTMVRKQSENPVKTSEGWPNLTKPPDVTNSTQQFNTAGSTPPTLALSKPAAEIPCSITKTSLKSGLDPSIDPYCHGDFILDNIRVSDAAGGGFDISMNVFIRGEADAALERYDAAGNLVDSTLMPGHRPIPASLFDFFIQNQINVYRGLTDEYPWNDDRDSFQSQMTRDVRIHVPAGGRFELTKSSDQAITYNVIRMAIEGISSMVDTGGPNIMERRINEIAFTMGTEAADLARKMAFSGGKLDNSAAIKIVASVATVFLDPRNLDGRRVFQRSLKKAMGDTVFAGLSGVALEGKFFNILNAWLDIYNAVRNTGSAVYWRAKQVAPKTISKAKVAPRAGCNRGSSVLSPSIGGAQGALKKFGTGTDGCVK
jgi:hypothetical protein